MSDTLQQMIWTAVAEAMREQRKQHDAALASVRNEAVQEIRNAWEHAKQRIEEITASCSERIKALKDSHTDIRGVAKQLAQALHSTEDCTTNGEHEELIHEAFERGLL